MASSQLASSVVSGALIAAGLIVGGYFIGDGFLKGRQAERYVTVKGLSEREVKADIATWPLRFTATGDDLASVQAKIEQDADALLAFLRQRGLPAEDAALQRLEVVDLLAQQYRSGPIEGNRFIITQTVLVRTPAVDLVETLSRDMGALVKAGVVLSDQMGPTYAFTGLNDIKPEMIAEATRNARGSAEQFAADSGSTVGSILRANQGVFQILPLAPADQFGMGEAGQIEKKVRVVATVDYLLDD